MGGTIVVGAQWGDEGKGKIVDFLSKDADIVVRFNGGGNAGHTIIYNGVAFKLHYVPSGVFQGKQCILGNGMVIDPKSLLGEVASIKKAGVEPHIFISRRAHIIFPHHIRIDKINGKAIGTTGKGIGPTYASKMERTNLRMGDITGNRAEETIKNALEKRKADFIIRNVVKENEFEDFERDTAKRYALYGEKLRRYVRDIHSIINSALKDRSVLFEGAQGVMLDIDFGTYPFVTSSNTVAQGAFNGAGASPFYIKRIVGVSKAYATRVGEGPFPTELAGPAEELLRNAGKEFGATTGRPRRVGYLDLFALKYAVNVSSITEIALTKIDILSALKEVKVAIGYKLDGELIDQFPASAVELEKVVPVYKAVSPIEKLTSEQWEKLKGKTKDDLPENIRGYVRFIEDYIGVPITVLSFGPERDDTITYG